MVKRLNHLERRHCEPPIGGVAIQQSHDTLWDSYIATAQVQLAMTVSDMRQTSIITPQH